MKTAFVASLLIAATAAFPTSFDPSIARSAENFLAKRASFNLTHDPLGLSKAETNCGPDPCLTFDPTDQLVSVTGEYAYASPAADEIRGPCPGLNAAANHGYLPRSGIASIEETIQGLGAAYNLAPDITGFLAAYAILFDGNIIEGVWSIGGPLPSGQIGSGVIGNGYGLSYSHNNYEGDASIGRFDAYTNHGDAHSLNVAKFTEVYAIGGKEDRYTLDKFRQKFHLAQQASIATNPYYFTGLFSTVVVVPAAYNFVINLMSNHSAAEPSGYLNGAIFKSFFAVSGTPGKFVWNRGQERIPENWYRRPTITPYHAQDVANDVAIGYAAYPDTLLIGGNTGKTNSFLGVQPGNLTGGVITTANLFQGDNFACFFFGLAQNGIFDFIKGPLGVANKYLDKYLDPITSKLDCPQLGKYDQSFFNQFPGYHYNPRGKDTNY